MSSAVVSVLPFADQFAGRLLPAALAQSGQPSQIEGKDGLIVLNDRPLNAEVPAHLLDDKVTPASRLFVRNNGIPPSIKGIDVDDWTLEITGESCLRSSQVTLGRLKREFKHHTYQLLLECAGNGRSEFNPPALGNQWTVGGVGCPRWTGVRLRDVLIRYGLRKDAVYITSSTLRAATRIGFQLSVHAGLTCPIERRKIWNIPYQFGRITMISNSRQ